MPWASVIYAGDTCWWYAYHDEVIDKCSGQRWTVAKPIAQKYPRMRWLEATAEMGLSKHPDKVAHGGFSGYQAIGLAVLFGATRILLLGYDCQATNGLSHWHGDHPGKLNKPTRFDRWQDRLNGLAKAAKQRNVSIINCSAETALTCFPRASLQACLAEVAA